MPLNAVEPGVVIVKFQVLRSRAAQLRPHVLSFALTLSLAILTLVAGGPAAAQAVPVGYAVRPIIVRNDVGGDVGVRANKISAMAASGQSVEIRGSVCYSACTMYLGLPGTCISRTTQFGFHRPSYYGAALSPDQFEFWSQVIAAHYPPPLRKWYLREGRYSTKLKMISGAELIRLGVPECF